LFGGYESGGDGGILGFLCGGDFSLCYFDCLLFSFGG